MKLLKKVDLLSPPAKYPAGDVLCTPEKYFCIRFSATLNLQGHRTSMIKCP